MPRRHGERRTRRTSCTCGPSANAAAPTRRSRGSAARRAAPRPPGRPRRHLALAYTGAVGPGEACREPSHRRGRRRERGCGRGRARRTDRHRAARQPRQPRGLERRGRCSVGVTVPRAHSAGVRCVAGAARARRLADRPKRVPRAACSTRSALGRVHLVVHDVGAAYGVAFATAHPERLRSMTIFTRTLILAAFWARVSATPVHRRARDGARPPPAVRAHLRRGSPRLPARVRRARVPGVRLRRAAGRAPLVQRDAARARRPGHARSSRPRRTRRSRSSGARSTRSAADRGPFGAPVHRVATPAPACRGGAGPRQPAQSPARRARRCARPGVPVLGSRRVRPAPRPSSPPCTRSPTAPPRSAGAALGAWSRQRGARSRRGARRSSRGREAAAEIAAAVVAAAAAELARAGAAPRDQRDRRRPAHEPRARAARRRGARRDRRGRARLHEPRVRPRARRARLAPRSPARAAARADRRRGRDRRQQQRRGDRARPRGARRRQGDRRVARRADRDRRLVPAARDPRAVARHARRDRHDEQDPRARLRAGDRPGDRPAPQGPPLELRDRRIHRGGRARGGRRDRPRARHRDDDRSRLGHARAARRSAGGGCPTSRPSPRRSRAARTS